MDAHAGVVLVEDGDRRAEHGLEALGLHALLRAEARILHGAGGAHRSAAGDRLGDDAGGDGAPHLLQLGVAEAAGDPERFTLAGAELEVALLRRGHLDDEVERVLQEGAQIVPRAQLEQVEEEVALQAEAIDLGAGRGHRRRS